MTPEEIQTLAKLIRIYADENLSLKGDTRKAYLEMADQFEELARVRTAREEKKG